MLQPRLVDLIDFIIRGIFGTFRNFECADVGHVLYGEDVYFNRVDNLFQVMSLHLPAAIIPPSVFLRALKRSLDFRLCEDDATRFPTRCNSISALLSVFINRVHVPVYANTFVIL